MSDLTEDYDLPSAELKWAPWKVTLGVVLFCGAFWALVYYLLARFLG